MPGRAKPIDFVDKYAPLFLERFDTMALDLYLDVDRGVFVFRWTSPGRAAVGEYALRDMVA